jgi:hypothetical protein
MTRLILAAVLAATLVGPAGVSGSATLTIATAAGAPTGTYALTVTGTSGTTSHSAGLTLIVAPPPDFSLTASPASVSVLRRQVAAYTVSTVVVGGSRVLSRSR